jgi:hypothetical protein
LLRHRRSYRELGGVGRGTENSSREKLLAFGKIGRAASVAETMVGVWVSVFGEFDFGLRFASSRLVGGPSSAGRGDAGVRDTLRVNVAWLFRVDCGLSW